MVLDMVVITLNIRYSDDIYTRKNPSVRRGREVTREGTNVPFSNASSLKGLLDTRISNAHWSLVTAVTQRKNPALAGGSLLKRLLVNYYLAVAGLTFKGEVGDHLGHLVLRASNRLIECHMSSVIYTEKNPRDNGVGVSQLTPTLP